MDGCIEPRVDALPGRCFYDFACQRGTNRGRWDMGLDYNVTKEAGGTAGAVVGALSGAKFLGSIIPVPFVGAGSRRRSRGRGAARSDVG